MADIPGLIEGASQGTGLGFDFLKHIERTRIIVHILDVMPSDDSDPAENYRIINNELAQYSEVLTKKIEIVVANKIDLDHNGEKLNELRSKLNKKIYPISAVTGSGIRELNEVLWKKVRESKENAE